MKPLFTLALIALSFVACNSCTTQPAPVNPEPTPDPVPFPPEPYDAAPEPMGDAAPGTPAGDACVVMHALGCDEAESVKACTDVMQHAIDSHLTRVDVPCLTRAQTRAAVRACHFVSCAGEKQ